MSKLTIITCVVLFCSINIASVSSTPEIFQGRLDKGLLYQVNVMKRICLQSNSFLNSFLNPIVIANDEFSVDCQELYATEHCRRVDISECQKIGDKLLKDIANDIYTTDACLQNEYNTAEQLINRHRYEFSRDFADILASEQGLNAQKSIITPSVKKSQDYIDNRLIELLIDSKKTLTSFLTNFNESILKCTPKMTKDDVKTLALLTLHTIRECIEAIIERTPSTEASENDATY